MKNFGIGLNLNSLALGAGVVLVAPIVLPIVGSILKPVVKAVVKGGLLAYEGTRCSITEAKAEVKQSVSAE